MDNHLLDVNLVTQEIIDGFKASQATGLDWTDASHANNKQLLKDLLFDAQNSKCAYCRRSIKEELGHVEIDHILPKAQRGKPVRWSSNNRGHRRSTAGYPAFVFHPHNLILTCKSCNTKKGSYDPRLDRSVAASEEYVFDEMYYEWIHPYIHVYSQHIALLKGMIYQVVNGSAKGDAVITVCKLDKIAAVERKACERKVKGSVQIAMAFLKLSDHYEQFEWEEIIGIVHAQFPNKSLEEVREGGEEIRLILVRAGGNSHEQP